jgi:CPA1 family monovalent cation:H+ antiporter
MRGVVTLAAAFAIPADSPHREVLLLVALVVTGGTLLIQGLTLPWLVRRLRVPAPDPRQDALLRAELLQTASRAGLSRLDELESGGDEQDDVVRGLLRSRLEQRDFAAWERLGPDDVDGETPSESYARLRLEMLGAERARVLEVRSEGRTPHEVIEDVLSSLDIEESMIGYGMERRQGLGAPRSEEIGMDSESAACEHLADIQVLPDPEDRRCVDCVREGSTWVHLRVCQSCGHVGCCDSSPRRHASLHYGSTDHPVIRSAEPGERWRWCFVDEVLG